MYSKYLENYKNNNIKPEPWELLFVLLLEDRESFSCEKIETNLSFYTKYKDKINVNMKQIITDFNIPNEDPHYENIIWTIFDGAVKRFMFVLVSGQNLTIEEICDIYDIRTKKAQRKKRKFLAKNSRK